jgi:hypothetical protein
LFDLKWWAEDKQISFEIDQHFEEDEASHKELIRL